MAPHAANPTDPGSPFKSKQLVIQQAGKLGLVQLSFARTPEMSVLYAHFPYLIASSGVLRGILEEQDCQHQPAKVARSNSSADIADAYTTQIPLDDEDTAAWECVLSMLYPHTVLQARVTWENAQGLLLLADKYDIPMVLERVKEFLDAPVGVVGMLKRTRLGQGLTAENVFNWLQVFSRCGMTSHIKCCVGYIVRNELQLPDGYLSSGIQHQHIEQLFKAVRKNYDFKATSCTCEVASLTKKLAAAEKQLKEEKGKAKLERYNDAICSRCLTPWYWLLDKSKESPVCVGCGVLKRTGFEA